MQYKKVFHSKEELAAAVVVYILKRRKKESGKWKKRSTLVKPWLTRRDALGFYYTLMYEFSFPSSLY